MQNAAKTFVITGAGGGIGRQLSLRLTEKGANVAGIDLNQKALGETARLAWRGNGDFKQYVADITSGEEVQKLTRNILTEFGHGDCLINNAGIIQPFKPVQQLSAQEIDRVFKVNFFAALELTQAFLPSLLSRPEANITNISSMGGFLPVPGQTIYGAAKAAVKLMSEGLHAELLETNVTVTTVFLARSLPVSQRIPGPESQWQKWPSLQ